LLQSHGKEKLTESEVSKDMNFYLMKCFKSDLARLASKLYRVIGQMKMLDFLIKCNAQTRDLELQKYSIGLALLYVRIEIGKLYPILRKL
jgi:hypothetical protein